MIIGNIRIELVDNIYRLTLDIDNEALKENPNLNRVDTLEGCGDTIVEALLDLHDEVGYAE